MKRLLLLCLPLACLAQDVVPVVCPDCDVEAREAPWTCPRCGRPLEAPAGEPEEAAPAPAGEPAARPSGPADAASALREDARFAASAATAAALAAVRNAIALAAIAPDALSAAERRALHDRETALLARLASESATCPHCHGTGRVDAPKPPKAPAGRGRNFKPIESVAVSDLNAAPTRPCPLCSGTGKARRATDRGRLAGLAGLGARDYGRAARGAGREELHGVWLPAGLPAALDDAARDALRRAAPALRACPDCAGTGTRPCRACGGFGRVLCPNRDFHSAPKPAGQGADRQAIESTILAPVSREPCSACGGTWDAPRAVACPDCAGRGVSACPSCTGTGLGSGTR